MSLAPALAAGVPMAALILPPLLAHPESLALKSGIDLPHMDTLLGVWYTWFGTGSTIALLICAAFAVASARANEVPDDARLRLRNAVHLADATALSARGVNFVAWQKPYRYVANGIDAPVGADVAPCSTALAARFGLPVYEDEWLAIYRPPDRAGGTGDVGR